MFIVRGMFYVLYEPLAGDFGASEWFSKATRIQKEGARKVTTGVIVFLIEFSMSMVMFPFLRHENMVVQRDF